MPNRVLREGILKSESVTSISRDAELFYRCLMSVADDFGRYDANPRVLRSDCFPLREGVTAKEVESWLAECVAAKDNDGIALISIYEVDRRKYLQINKWKQRLRIMKSKWPLPPWHKTGLALAEKGGESDSEMTDIWQSDDGHLSDIGLASDGPEARGERREARISSGVIGCSTPPTPIGPVEIPVENQPPPLKKPKPDSPKAIQPSPSTRAELRVSTKQVGRNGLHKPMAIEFPDLATPGEIKIAEWLKMVTDGRMDPPLPELAIVRQIFQIGVEHLLTREDVQSELGRVLHRQRKGSQPHWNPESWGWFPAVLKGVLEARKRPKSMSGGG